MDNVLFKTKYQEWGTRNKDDPKKIIYEWFATSNKSTEEILDMIVDNSIMEDDVKILEILHQNELIALDDYCHSICKVIH